jgi:NitT/TauT family transport system ATP-binding protein
VSAGVAVRIEDVRKAFQDHVVIASMSLRIEAGEFVAVLGPSGCGKSTLLRMIAGLARPDSGSILTEPGGAGFQRAFVFQDAHLLPWRNVLDNAALPLELMGAARDERHRKARAALEKVSLLDAIERYPAQLSGGMRMRVSLARALVTEPQLLLLDEPFAALDEITRFHLDVQLRELWRERRMTVIFVTHSISEAAFLADRAVVMGKRGGNITLDREMELPEARTNELRGDPSFGLEMKALLGAIEE